MIEPPDQVAAGGTALYLVSVAVWDYAEPLTIGDFQIEGVNLVDDGSGVGLALVSGSAGEPTSRRQPIARHELPI
jgi:hypothetical protein